MEPNLEELRNTYQRFSDDKLIKIATGQASDLRPEAIQVIREEIQRRGLSPDLLRGVEVQRKELSPEERKTYCDLIQKQPCPHCGSSSARLNAVLVGSVRSFVFFTNRENALVLGCPSCLRKASKSELIKTALLGWWGIPWGIFYTAKALILNYQMLGKADQAQPSEPLLAFVEQNVGKIESYQSSPQRLNDLLVRPQ